MMVDMVTWLWVWPPPSRKALYPAPGLCSFQHLGCGQACVYQTPRWEVLTWAVLSYKLGSFTRFHLEGPLPLLEGTLVPRSRPRPAVHPPLALAMLVGWLNGCRGTRRFLLWASVFHW